MRSDGYMAAWMLYQLTGNEEAETVFLGESAEILTNKNWQDIEKNRYLALTELVKELWQDLRQL